MLEIKEIKKNKTDLMNFINLPWKIYNGDPNWVPPLKSDLLNSF